MLKFISIPVAVTLAFPPSLIAQSISNLHSFAGSTHEADEQNSGLDDEENAADFDQAHVAPSHEYQGPRDPFKSVEGTIHVDPETVAPIYDLVGRKTGKQANQKQTDEYLNNAVESLVLKGFTKTASDLCIATAIESGTIPAYTPYRPRTKFEEMAPEYDYRVGAPSIFQRNECQDNFEKDRCEKLFIAATNDRKQALFQSALVREDGTIDKAIYERVSKALGYSIPLSAESSGQLKIETLISEEVPAVAAYFKKEGLSEEERKIIGQDPMITLTQLLVSRIDFALASENRKAADEFLVLLKEVNPSAATGLDCLLKFVPSQTLDQLGSASSEKHHVGPISGFDYTKEQLKHKNSSKDLTFITVAVGLVNLVVVMWYGSRNDLREEERRKEEIKASRLKEKDAEYSANEEKRKQIEFSWKVEDRKKQEAAEAEAKAVAARKALDAEKKAAENGSSIHHAPGNSTGPTRPIEVIPGSGGNGGEFLPNDAESQLAALLQRQVQEEYDRIEEAQKNSIMSFDPYYIDEFCSNVIKAVQCDIDRAWSNSITIDEKVAEALNNFRVGSDAILNRNNGIIDFAGWKPKDQLADPFADDYKESKNCHVMYPVGS